MTRTWGQFSPVLSACLILCGLEASGFLLSRGGAPNSLKGFGASPEAPTFQLRLANRDGVFYVAELSLGGQVLEALYDTGSFEILALPARWRAGAYDRSRSSTYESGTERAEFLFEAGPVVASSGRETVRLGGSDSPMLVRGMSFWEAASHDIAQWKDEGGADFDAIVGLGLTVDVPSDGAHAESGETLLSRLSVRRFAICIEPGPGGSGWLTFSPPAVAHVHPFKSVQVEGQFHWAARMTEVGFGGDMPGCEPSCAAVIDSGTSFIAFPKEFAEYMSPHIRRIRFDCSNLHSLPDLVFKLGNELLSLPPSVYVLEEREGAQRRCVPAFAVIDRHSQLGPIWIFGLPFLRRYHTVFDRSTRELHLSTGVACGVEASTAHPPVQFSATNTSDVATSEQLALANLTKGRLPLWANGTDSQLIQL